MEKKLTTWCCNKTKNEQKKSEKESGKEATWEIILQKLRNEERKKKFNL